MSNRGIEPIHRSPIEDGDGTYTGPQQNYAPNGPASTAARGTSTAVIVSVDNETNPKYATIAVKNRSPYESGYSLPLGVGPFKPGGTAGYHYFYDNASGVGGSLCTVDLDARKVISISSDVSLSAPVPFYQALSDHNHSGNLSPDGFYDPQPVNLSGSETQGNLPYTQNTQVVQGVISSTGDIIATEFPTQTTLMVNGTYKGLFKQVVPALVDTKAYTLPSGTWLWMDWYSMISDASQAWGPEITDGTHTYSVRTSAGAGSLFLDGTVLTTLNANTLNNNSPHSFSLGIEYVGGTTWRILCIADGTILCDYTDTTSPLSATIFPGFYCSVANVVYHKDYSVYTNNIAVGQFLGNPNLASPPVFASGYSYPLAAPNLYYVGSGVGVQTGSYDAILSFGLTTGAPSWMTELRIYAVSNGGAGVIFQNPQFKGDYAPQSNGLYTVVASGLSAGTPYDIWCVFVDNNARESAPLKLVTTAANPMVVGRGSQASGATGVLPKFFVSSAYNSSPYNGSAIFRGNGNATCEFQLPVYSDAVGTKSTLWLAEIQLVAATAGSTTATADPSTWTVKGNILIPDSSSDTSYSTAIWSGLGSGNTYDLGIRFVDYDGHFSYVVVVESNVTIPKLNLGQSAVSMPANVTLTVTQNAAPVYSGVGGATFQAQVSFNLSISDPNYSNWLGGISVLGQQIPVTQNTVNPALTDPATYYDLKNIVTNTLASPYTVTIPLASSAQAYQIAVQVYDTTSHATIAYPFTITTPQQIGPTAITGSNNTNLIADSDQTQANVAGGAYPAPGPNTFGISSYWTYAGYQNTWNSSVGQNSGFGVLTPGSTGLNQNHLGISTLGATYTAVAAYSEPIYVTPGQTYCGTVTFASTRIVNGQFNIGAVSVGDKTANNATPQTVYATKILALVNSNGNSGAGGTYSFTYTVPTTGGPTQVVFCCYALNINANFYWVEPQFELGTSYSGYKSGPNVTSTGTTSYGSQPSQVTGVIDGSGTVNPTTLNPAYGQAPHATMSGPVQAVVGTNSSGAVLNIPVGPTQVTGTIPYNNTSVQFTNTVLPTADPSSSSYLASSTVATSQVQAVAINSNQIAKLRYDTSTQNLAGGTAGQYQWYGSSYLAANAVLTSGATYTYDVQNANDGGSSPAPSDTYTLPANGLASLVFKHGVFSSGTRGVISVNFTGNSVAQGANVATSTSVSGSGQASITSSTSSSTTNQANNSSIGSFSSTTTITQTANTTYANTQHSSGNATGSGSTATTSSSSSVTSTSATIPTRTSTCPSVQETGHNYGTQSDPNWVYTPSGGGTGNSNSTTLTVGQAPSSSYPVVVNLSSLSYDNTGYATYSVNVTVTDGAGTTQLNTTFSNQPLSWTSPNITTGATGTWTVTIYAVSNPVDIGAAYAAKPTGVTYNGSFSGYTGGTSLSSTPGGWVLVYQTPAGTLAPTSSATQLSFDVSGASISSGGNTAQPHVIVQRNSDGVTVKDCGYATSTVTTFTYFDGSAPAGIYNVWYRMEVTTLASAGGSLSSTATVNSHYYTSDASTSYSYSAANGPTSSYSTASAVAPTTSATAISLAITSLTTPSNAGGASGLWATLTDPNNAVVTSLQIPSTGTYSYSNTSAIAGMYTWKLYAYIKTDNQTASESYTVTAAGSIGWYVASSSSTTTYYENGGQASNYTTPSSTLAPTSATQAITLNLSSVTAPSNSYGSSKVVVYLKNPAGAAVSSGLQYSTDGGTTWNNCTALTVASAGTTNVGGFSTGAIQYRYYAAGAAAGTYTWVVYPYVVSNSNGTSQYSASWNGTSTWYIVGPSGGNTYVIASDGVTQRTATADADINFILATADTVSFQVFNSAAQAVTFSIGVDVQGI